MSAPTAYVLLEDGTRFEGLACGAPNRPAVGEIVFTTAMAGYQEAILLDSQGVVSEGSGENLFVVKDGCVITPSQSAGILDGITRKSVITIARDLARRYRVSPSRVADS